MSRVVDLLVNADRRIDQGRYDDAVARLYRLCEYVAQVRFRRRFGIPKDDNPTSKVPIEALAAQAPNLARDLQSRKTLTAGRLDLGLRDAIHALAEAGDEIGRLMNERYEGTGAVSRTPRGKLGEFLDRRNQSLLAHGSVPVPETTARELREEVAAILREHIRAEGLQWEELVEGGAFLWCPWV